MPGLIIGISLGFVIILTVGWAIVTFNSFKRMVVKIDESESEIDLALTKRFDLFKQLFDATKEYMKNDTETLLKVIEMKLPHHVSPMEDKQQFANEVTKGIQNIYIFLEQYPELKSSQGILKLQDATLETEENLQSSRRIYNSNVSYYNQKVVVFPSNMIANWKKFEKKAFFEAETIKRFDVKNDI